MSQRNQLAAGDLSIRPLNILIVGMARSGTSMTAAILARKGYYVGSIANTHLRDGDDDNPDGYFEADDLVASNVEVLRRAGFKFHNTWMYELISQQAVSRINTLHPLLEHRRFVESYQSRTPWLWKDPRLCFTLRYWWQLMNPNTTGVVFVKRDPTAIYRSFLRLGWCRGGAAERAKVRRCVDAHTRAAANAVHSLRIPHIVIDYSEYLDRPGDVAMRLAGFCGIKLAVLDLNVRYDLNHSTFRGRLSARVRRSVDYGVLRHARRVRNLVPDRVLTVVFPEKKYRKCR